jgi:hypothetical protein
MDHAYSEQNVFIWGKTYPELSSKYLETVCTGGVLENGSPLRLYPIAQRYLDGDEKFSKYQWVKIRIKSNNQDSRPESFKVDRFSEITLGDKIGATNDEWGKRADIVFRDSRWIFDSVEDLLKAEKSRKTSLGVVEPKEILKIGIKKRPPEEAIDFAEKLERLKRENEAKRDQLTLFGESVPPPMRDLSFMKERIQIDWVCKGSSCNGHKMTVLDWEAAELLRKRGESKALEKIRSVLNLSTHASRFFLGNLAQHPTSFTIVGIWYPKRSKEQLLF